MANRGVGMKSIETNDVTPTGNQRFKMIVNLKNGLDKENGKVINKIVKNSGFKLSSSYMDEKVRVTGKKIDDLQQLWELLKNHDDIKVDVQMENMKR